MNRIAIVLLALVGWLGAAALPARAQDPLVKKVETAIKKGVAYLREQQRNGNWESSAGAKFPSGAYPGGATCLALLALLEAGVDPGDKMMVDGLAYVRGLDSAATYVVSLQTQVLAKSRSAASENVKITENLEWLTKNRLVTKGGVMEGWGYGNKVSNTGDGSNTQFALLGLWAARDAGVPIPQKVWKSVRSYYVANQEKDGTWNYSPVEKAPLNRERMTMTTAGICGLLLSGLDIKEGREKLQPDSGAALDCGRYEDNPNLSRAMAWMEKNFQIEIPGRTFYNLYGIERLGRLTGHRFIGAHDWYREGCEWLVSRQGKDGSWHAAGFTDEYTLVSTSFALLFLSKGRTPILVSKLVHGDWPRDPADHDWNLDRNAVKHWTEHISKELFTKRDKSGVVQPLPLAWQNFDLMKAAARGKTEEDMQAITSDMLQSPLIFMNGHRAPKLTRIEKQLLKRYVENGGFIVAEACCGSKGFDQGFRELVKDADLWERNDLVPLSVDHPIWHYPNEVPPGSFKLHGLEMGCKTVLVHSPEDLSCYWEANDTKSARGVLAFKVAVNIVAYATGMTPPLPRLTETSVAGKDDDKKTPPRFYLKAAQLYYRKDWVPPAPAAMSNLMSHLRKVAGMDVVLTPEKIRIDHEDLANFKFVYFHDRGKFTFNDDDLGQLRFNLENGGLLFADACCGSKVFDESFRKFAKQLFPKHELQRVPVTDALFGKELNGVALTKSNILARQAPGQPLEKMEPWLEGIKVDDRWVVLYSKFDVGCALERHQANDCIGYDHNSALRIAGAAVLYLMSP